MPLANCVRCKKMFSKDRQPVCPACEADEEADFEKVRQYIEERPNQSIKEVADGTGVSEACVLRLIDDGKIASVAMGQSITCGQCGAPAISATKRLCQECLTKLNMRLAQEQAKIKLPPRKSIDLDDHNVRRALDEKRK